MEYKLKLSLMDDKSKTLVSTDFDEEYLRGLKHHHSELDWMTEIVKVMKLQHETGSPVPLPDLESRNWFKERMKKVLVERKTKPIDGVFEAEIEAGSGVTREDVQDYIAFYGGSPEEALQKMKAFYLGETDTI